MKKFIAYLIAILILIAIVCICIYYVSFPELLKQKFHPTTKLDHGRALVVSDRSELELLDIREASVTKTTIDAGTDSLSFVDARMAENKIYYLKQTKPSGGTIMEVQLLEYDIVSKTRTVMDTYTENVNGKYSLDRTYKLAYNASKKQILVFHAGQISAYTPSHLKPVGITILWDVVVTQDLYNAQHGGIRLSPSDRDVHVATAFYDTAPIAMRLEGQNIKLLFENFYTNKKEYLENACKELAPSDDQVGTYSVPLVCSIVSNYSCHVECPDQPTFINLNRPQANNVSRDNEVVLLANSSYFFTFRIYGFDSGCSGSISIGPCIEYHVTTLRKIDQNGVTDFYQEGSKSGVHFKNVGVSGNEQYVIYATYHDGIPNTYILSLSGGFAPRIVARNAFPLYIE